MSVNFLKDLIPRGGFKSRAAGWLAACCVTDPSSSFSVRLVADSEAEAEALRGAAAGLVAGMVAGLVAGLAAGLVAGLAAGLAAGLVA